MRRKDIIYPELSYKINGLLFEVFKELGPGHLERHYEKAIAIKFLKNGVSFREQFYIPIKFEGQSIGKRVVDFLVDGKIIIEIKRGEFVPVLTIKQALDYLKILNLKLGLVACFTNKGVFIKRVLNTY